MNGTWNECGELSTKEFTAILLGICALLIIGVVWYMSLVGEATKPTNAEPKNDNIENVNIPIQKEVDNGESRFSIVKYKGHVYLFYEDGRYRGFVHHPDCPCQHSRNNEHN